MAGESFLSQTGLAVAYTVMCGLLGMAMMSLAAFVIPRVVNKVTPNIDDEKEILRGNIAVGTYVGMVTAAVIIGMSIILAAAIIAGLM